MNRFKQLLTLSLLLGLMASVSSQELTLSQVTQFDSARTGRGAGESQTYRLYSIQLERGEEARPVFLDCLKQGTPPARLYGALGLYHLDSKAGKLALQDLLQDSSPVNFTDGCLIMSLSVQELAKRLLSDGPDALSPANFRQ